MKKKVLIAAPLVLIVIASLIFVIANKPAKPASHIIYKKPSPAQPQVTHGITPPYTECYPNKPETKYTKIQQDEIASTETEMTKYNNTPSNTENPELKRLNTLHEQEIAAYDTCETIN